MAERQLMLIEGKPVAAMTDRWLPVRNPATGEIIAEVPAGGEGDVDRAVSAARHEADHGEWPQTSPGHRAKVLNKLADLIEDRVDEFSILEATNNGRPIHETRAQIGIVPEFFRYNAALAVTLRGETIPVGDGYLAYIQRVPLGVAAVMTPYNHPMLIAARGIAPALASGNTVVVKPSELTPLTTLLLAELALEAGVPPAALNVVIGTGPEAGAALTNDAGVNRIEFTGGTETGRSVAAAAGRNFGKVTAELGGKTPVLIFDDAALDDAVAGAAFAGFIAAGQSCVAGARIIVHQSVANEFTGRLVDLASSIRLGDPLDAATQMGPVISAAARDRTLRYANAAADEGAKILQGGAVPNLEKRLAGGFFVEPTVIGGVTEDMTIAREEVFGPLVSIETFHDEEDGIRKANGTPFGLGAAVWSRDIGRAHRVAEGIRAGMTWVNDHHRLSPAMPWGGFKDSGVGKQAGTESFLEFFEKKTVVVRTADGAPSWFTQGDTTRLN
jgi:acyl-CoA reductase-like NAD-dependent aldehyde dehydrogenase